MDLFIYKGEEFFVNGKLDVSVFQKQENKYMYLLTYFDHTASQAIGTEMHAYTVGFFMQ